MALVPPERGSRATSTTRRELILLVYSARARKAAEVEEAAEAKEDSLKPLVSSTIQSDGMRKL